MTFAYPYGLLAVAVPVIFCFIYHKRMRVFRILIPQGLGHNGRHRLSWSRLLIHTGWLLFLLMMVSLIIALARPYVSEKELTVRRDGLDIYLVIDTSKSMSEEDMMVNHRPVTRLDAVKEVVSEFIGSRPDDRIGLVIFGSTAFAQAPLTSDHFVLRQFLD
ncbi:MAG: VWA domain-containing protein, partial [Proteobacteria bacterium]|nr:VWA domain-containing protein [Pseudomonadota bacterium]